jgi:hypothetical protein
MYADFYAVTDSAAQLSIETSLRIGGDDGTYAELTGADRLFVNANESSLELSHDQRGANRHFYLAQLENIAEEAEIQIEFSRASDKESALNSFAFLPPGFTPALELEDDDSELSRDLPLNITWDNQGDQMHWDVEGDCIWSRSGVVTDIARLTLSNDEIEVKNLDEGDSCVVTLTLERQNKGIIDQAFGEGGRFLAVNRRQLEFVSTPGADEALDGEDGSAGDTAEN